MKKIAVIVMLASTLVCGIIFTVNMTNAKNDAELIKALSASANMAFNELLTQMRQGKLDYKMAYRDAVSKYYALYAVSVRTAQKNGKECLFRQEMNELYGQLIISEEITPEAVEFIISACNAIYVGENHSSVSQWLLKAKNSVLIDREGA